MTVAAFRVVQESLTNAVRHARARNVWVELRQRDDALDLAIRDDGVGFDPESARNRAARGESFGLLGIQDARPTRWPSRHPVPARSRMYSRCSWL